MLWLYLFIVDTCGNWNIDCCVMTILLLIIVNLLVLPYRDIELLLLFVFFYVLLTGCDIVVVELLL